MLYQKLVYTTTDATVLLWCFDTRVTAFGTVEPNWCSISYSQGAQGYNEQSVNWSVSSESAKTSREYNLPHGQQILTISLLQFLSWLGLVTAD